MNGQLLKWAVLGVTFGLGGTALAAPEEPAAQKVTVNFRAKDSAKKYDVSTADGQKCSLPCALKVPPGPNLFTFGGDTSTSHFITVGDQGGTLEVAFPDQGLRTTKIVLYGVGAVAAAVGFALSPILGAIPLLVLGVVGLACLIPALLINTDATLNWVDARKAAAEGVPVAARATGKRITTVL